jgi:PAS domain S-box-containing protein/putative nucleotidyltransferase with HDIG domain
MEHGPDGFEPENLYELSWVCAPEGMFAMEAATGELFNVNPAAEALSGRTRAELLGLDIALLHPEDERTRVKSEFLEPEKRLALHTGFHIQRKDNGCVPVTITSSRSLLLDGRAAVIHAYRDVTDLEQREHRLATKRWALAAYAGAASALWQHQSPESLLQSICEAITRESVYALTWVGIAEDGPGKPIRVAAEAGNAAGILDGLHLSWLEDERWGQGPTPVCIRTQQTQIIEETENLTVDSRWTARFREFGIRSSASIPFVTKGGIRGALVVCARQANAFEAVALEAFKHLAEQIGYGLHTLEQERNLKAERARLTKMQAQLTEALSAMVAPIVLAMEMRDPYTAGHQSRVAEIAVAIAKEMGWPEEQVQGLRIAAQVHDIGKISIPAEILTKPGAMNPAERAMINEHAEIGYRILKDIPFQWPIAEIVRQHHEKLDGSGYPKGLKGDEMLPEAKVLAVADVVEAMASYRPYRPGIKLHLILQQIEKDAGTLLDAEAVRVCLTLFREKHFVVPGWVRQ